MDHEQLIFSKEKVDNASTLHEIKFFIGRFIIYYIKLKVRYRKLSTQINTGMLLYQSLDMLYSIEIWLRFALVNSINTYSRLKNLGVLGKLFFFWYTKIIVKFHALQSPAKSYTILIWKKLINYIKKYMTLISKNVFLVLKVFFSLNHESLTK